MKMFHKSDYAIDLFGMAAVMEIFRAEMAHYTIQPSSPIKFFVWFNWNVCHRELVGGCCWFIFWGDDWRRWYRFFGMWKREIQTTTTTTTYDIVLNWMVLRFIDSKFVYVCEWNLEQPAISLIVGLRVSFCRVIFRLNQLFCAVKGQNDLFCGRHDVMNGLISTNTSVATSWQCYWRFKSFSVVDLIN
jgi:hypothetical protein